MENKVQATGSKHVMADGGKRKNRRMRGKILVILAALLFLSGAALVAYPSVTRSLYRVEAENINSAFTVRMEEARRDDPGGQDDLYEKMLQYNQELYRTGQSGLVDAFSYEQVDFSLRDFGFDEEMIGYLSIPEMKVELPVYLGASAENLDRGAAHLSMTSLPVGGENTNAVIAAHRGHATADMFADIDILQRGDPVTMTNYRETLTYQVSDIAIIKPDEIDRVLIQPGRDMITLITCNPRGYNYERYVVYCEWVS